MYKIFFIFIILLSGCEFPENKYNHGEIVFHPILNKECQIIGVYKDYDNVYYYVRYNYRGGLGTARVSEYEIQQKPNER